MMNHLPEPLDDAEPKTPSPEEKPSENSAGREQAPRVSPELERFLAKQRAAMGFT